MPGGNRSSRVLVVVLIVMAACGSRLAQQTAMPIRTSPFDGDRGTPATSVLHAELEPLEAASLDDALRRLRPEWMRLNPVVRQVGVPGYATVYVDNLYAGSLEALSLVPISAVLSARFLSPAVARDRYGSACRCGNGVILLVTRAAQPRLQQ
jgi:hypothetical protein